VYVCCVLVLMVCISGHASIPAFGRILPLSRHIPTVLHRIHEIPFFCRIIKSSTFLVTEWILSYSKCAKTWLAGVPPQTLLGSLQRYLRPVSRLGRGRHSTTQPLWHLGLMLFLVLTSWHVCISVKRHFELAAEFVKGLREPWS